MARIKIFLTLNFVLCLYTFLSTCKLEVCFRCGHVFALASHPLFFCASSMFVEMRKLWKAERSALLPAALIYTFGSFGGVLLSSTHVYLVEQAVCRKHYMLYEPARVGTHGLVDEGVCKMPEIEARVASIYGIYSSLWYLPTLFLAAPYGKIGSLLGRRTVLFMNLSSSTVAAIYFMSICYFYQYFDIRWIYLAPFFDVFGGGSVILSSFLFTFVSENVRSRCLSGVLYKLSAIQLLMTFLGLTVSSYTLRRSVWLQVSVGIACSAMLIPVALLLPESRQDVSPEVKVTDEEGEVVIERLKDDIEPAITESTSLLPHIYNSDAQIPRSTPEIIPTLAHTLSTHHTHTMALVKRIFSTSPFVRTTLLTYFILTLGMGVRVIFAEWSSITYDWIFAEVNALTSFEMIVSGIVLLSLPALTHFLTRRTHFASASTVDIFIAMLSILANALGLLLMAFAPTRVTYVAANGFFTLGCGVYDSLRSFVTGQVSKEEIEDLYLGIAMMETMGSMFATVGWSGVLAEVLEKGYWLERIPFMGAAGVLVGVAGCMFVLGRSAKKLVKGLGDDV